MVFDFALNMVFNSDMDILDVEKFIESQGGSSKLAKRLKLPAKSGAQTVHNWKTRGIPASVMLNNRTLFSPLLKRKSK